MSLSSRSKVLLTLAIFSFALRFWGIADSKTYENDEVSLIPAISNYMENGQFEPDSWEHPPMKYFLLSGSMKIFGNNAYGWRMKSVVFGSLSIVVLFLIGSALFADQRVPFLAALLLAVDPLHIFASRLVLEEVAAMFFFLLAVYLTILYVQDKVRSPVLAGIFAGIAVAQKWYFALPLFTLGLSTLLYQVYKKRLNVLEGVHLFTLYSILPITVYLIPFFPWFQRGYSFPEFLHMQVDAYYFLQDAVFDLFNAFLKSTPASPREWFLKPLITVMPLAISGSWLRFVVFMNNFPVWLLAIPAFVFLAYRILRSREWILALIPLLFFSTYLQFALIDRAMFLYSALVVLPYAHLFIAYFLLALLDRLGGRPWHYRMLLIVNVAWGLYLYPFVTNRYVPEFLYAPLVALGNVYIP